MALIFPPLCRDEDGLQAELVDTITPGSTEYMGMWVSPLGALQCTADAPAYYNHGLPFNNGLLCVSNQAIAYVQDSVPFSATGAVVMLGSPEPIVYYEQGVPFSGGGAIIADVIGGGPQTPIWGGMPSLSHFEWELKQDFDVSGYAYTNAESGPITDYRLVGEPAGFTISSEGVVSCSPGTAPGNYTLTIEALNSVGWSTVPGTLSWEIKAGVVPVWGTIPNFTTAETSLPREYNVEAFVTAPDDDPVQAYTLEVVPAGFIPLEDPTRGIIKAVDAAVGVYTIQISATNNAGKSLPAEFDWEITLGNYVPIWGNIPLISTSISTLPDTYDLSNHVTSPNPVDGVVHNYQLINSPPNFTIDPVTGVATAAKVLLNGSYTLYASAQNDVGTGYSQAITWEITDNYELIYDFTTGMPADFSYFREGDGRTNDFVGNVVSVSADTELLPGAVRSGDMWLGTEVDYGMQMEPGTTNLVTGDHTNAGTWAPTGVTLTTGETIGDDLGGIILTEDSSTGAHYVQPATDTTAIGTPEDFSVSVFIKRDPGQRYLVLAVGAVNSSDEVLTCWVFVDTLTWLVSAPNDEANSQVQMYGALVSPNKAGEYAQVVARLQNRSGEARDARLIVGGASGMTGGWDDAYAGTPGKVLCTAYNFEVCPHTVITSPVAPGETRGQSWANTAIPATPGSRVNHFAFQVVFRYPWAAGLTVVDDRIWYMADTGDDVSTENGVVIKEAGGQDLVVNLNSGGSVVSQARYDISQLEVGQAIDIRGRKTAADGYQVWLLLNARDEYDEGGTLLPKNWDEHTDATAEAKADLLIGIDKMQVGESTAGSAESAPVDMVIVRAGFGDYTEEEIKAWPSWTEPAPIPTVHPQDAEVDV